MDALFDRIQAVVPSSTGPGHETSESLRELLDALQSLRIRITVVTEHDADLIPHLERLTAAVDATVSSEALGELSTAQAERVRTVHRMRFEYYGRIGLILRDTAATLSRTEPGEEVGRIVNECLADLGLAIAEIGFGEHAAQVGAFETPEAALTAFREAVLKELDDMRIGVSVEKRIEEEEDDDAMFERMGMDGLFARQLFGRLLEHLFPHRDELTDLDNLRDAEDESLNIPKNVPLYRNGRILFMNLVLCSVHQALCEGEGSPSDAKHSMQSLDFRHTPEEAFVAMRRRSVISQWQLGLFQALRQLFVGKLQRGSIMAFRSNVARHMKGLSESELREILGLESA